MTCLIRSKNKPLLDQYTDMLGSDSAAYYVLCKNNGYPLEFTPFGESSELFQKLLAKNNYNYGEAIREKASMYYSSYYDQIGGDWTMNEADLSKIDSNEEPIVDYTPEKIDFSDVLDLPIAIDTMNMLNLSEIEQNLIEEDLNTFINKKSPKNAVELHDTEVSWLKEKQKKLVDSINKELIEAFGLEKHVDKDGNITFVSKEKTADGKALLIVRFCEYLENGNLGAYDQSGRIEAAANLIEISLTDSDPTTLNHELAHHYIRMFWDSELVLNLVKKLDNGDRSEGWQVRLEEKLIEEITNRSVDINENSFWGKLKQIIRSMFASLPFNTKERLLRKTALAFRINDQSIRLRRAQHILEFIDPTVTRVFLSGINRNILEFNDNIRHGGILYAILNFIEDNKRFFINDKNNPNSIERLKHDEYCDHVKNVLCGTNVLDSEFLQIYVYALRFINDSLQFNIGDPVRESAEYLKSLIEECSTIRASINANNGMATTSNSTSNTTRDENLVLLLEKIMSGLKTRIFEYTRSVPKEARNANDVKLLLEKLNMISDVSDQLVTFISEGFEELIRIKKFLDEARLNNYNGLSSLQIESLFHTIDGFYNPITKLISLQLYDQLVLPSGIITDIGIKIRDMLLIICGILLQLKDATKVSVKSTTNEFLFGTEDTAGVLKDVLTEEQEQRFMVNFDDLLIEGKLFDDVNALLPYIGIASRSKSTIIRVARTMILRANRKVRLATLKDASRLMYLYFLALPELKKLNSREVQSIFLERDKDGNLTGYITRRKNYGSFYKDMNDERDRLIDIANEKLKAMFGESAPQITYDSYNRPVLPETGDPAVDNILYEYADALDMWLCDNGNRLFTKSYYIQRSKLLSPFSRQAMNNVQSRINNILSSCPIIKKTINGKEVLIKATWELSPEDLLNLLALNYEYEQLGNLYYSNGVMKTGLELKIAQEISLFNEWKAGKIQYNQNFERFNAAIEEILSKYGLNSPLEAKFRKLNSKSETDPKFIDFVLSQISMNSDPNLDRLRKRRSDLKKQIKDFEQKSIDIEKKRRELNYWEELKRVEKEISDILEQMTSPEGKKWTDFFDTKPIMYDENTTLLEHLLQEDLKEYRASHPADSRSDEELKNGVLLDKYTYTHEWIDKSGYARTDRRTLSSLLRQVPKEQYKSFAVITVLSHLFSDADRSSSLYNQEYDDTDPATILPGDKYDNNEQWSKIESSPKIKALYDEIINVMTKANQKYPGDSRFDYRLPAIEARRLIILRRSKSLNELSKALNYNWQNEWRLNQRDDSDINYEDESLHYRADGTRINTVPVRYIGKLDDPNKLTSDVLGSIIAFIEAANNFEVKTVLVSELDLLKRQLSDREDEGIAKKEGRKSTHNIIKHLEHMMDDLLFDNRTKLFNNNQTFTKKQQKLIKFFLHFLHLGRLLMLGYNVTSQTMGFIESFSRSLIDVFIGKKHTRSDFFYGIKQLFKYSGSNIKWLGLTSAKNKMIGEMQRFGISKSIKESYSGTERNRLFKLALLNITGMAGFTIGDYSVSALLLLMTLHHIRLIDCPEIPKGFYSRHTIIAAFLRNNPDLSYKQAKKLALSYYNQSKTILADAYYMKDGMLVEKDEYKQYLNDVLEERVTGKAYFNLPEYLGTTPNADTPGYALWVLMRPFGILRSYMFTMIARNWNFAHDLQKRYIDEDGKVQKVNDMVDGFVNLDAGEFDISMYQGLGLWLKYYSSRLPILKKYIEKPNLTEESKELYNYAASKIGLEILSVCVFVGIATLFKAAQKGADDDDWYNRFGYLLSVRLVNSFLSILDPTSIMELIKNISTLISPLNDLINSINLLFDAVGLSGHDPLEEIKNGSYKGRSRLFRDVMKIAPFGNAYEDFSTTALKYRANWYLQQDKLIWASLGGAYDKLWD